MVVGGPRRRIIWERHVRNRPSDNSPACQKSRTLTAGSRFRWLAILLVRQGQRIMNNMTNVFILLGGIALFAVVVTLLDWLARRKDRQSRNRAA